MTELLVYTLIALGVLVLTVSLLRTGLRQVTEHSSQTPRPYHRHETTDASFLQLHDRIFDPRDYRWLRHDLSFPEAAEELARHRRHLALEWLESFRDLFQEMVRTPGQVPTKATRASAVSSWQLLWLALRFQFLINYAIFVVRFFGPYHQLIPSLSWVGSLRDLVAGAASKRPARDSMT